MTSNTETSVRWVLVAGTGIPSTLTNAETIAATAIGKLLANYHYGLISGGWEGIDEIVTRSYLQQLKSNGQPTNGFLIQVVSESRKLSIAEGHIVRVPETAREWQEALKYADAIIIIGGRGGTYVTWLGAMHDGMPRFPIASTSGDAETAFEQTVNYWELMPVPGITKAEFAKLGPPESDVFDIGHLAEYIISELLPRSLEAVDAVQRRRPSSAKSMFISYSHKDDHWVSRLRTLIRPAERRGLITTWIDKDIKPGMNWETQLQDEIGSSDFALLLMSPNLLNSTYVKDIELPSFQRRLENDRSRFRLFWVLLEPCNWEQFDQLKHIQAIGSLHSAVSEEATDADQQCRLIQVVDEIVKAMA
jgi:predicted Rossmann-fold nucleotide-binding protein